jgi:hypothetical protein
MVGVMMVMIAAIAFVVEVAIVENNQFSMYARILLVDKHMKSHKKKRQGRAFFVPCSMMLMIKM